MLLGRAGRAAATVAAGPAADQNHRIAGRQRFAHHIVFGRRRDHRADLHPFRHIAGMVNLRYLSGRQADLVAIGTVAGRRAGRNLALRQFSRQRVFQLLPRVGAAGHPHCLIYIGTTRQRIADRAAQAGRCAAERFDLGRVIVGLVLEHHQPRLRLAVAHRFDHDAASVVFIGFIEVGQLAGLFQLLHPQRGQVHQAHFARRIGIERVAGRLIFLIGCSNRRGILAVFDRHPVDRGKKGRMATMIRPVSVDHPDFGHKRVAPLAVAEIALAKGQIGQAHRQPHLLGQFLQPGLVQRAEPFQHRHIRRRRRIECQRFRLGQRRFARFHRVDAIGFYSSKLLVRQLAIQRDQFRGNDLRPVLLGHDLDALRRPVGPLVILSGQILHGEHPCVGPQFNRFIRNHIGGRLGKHRLPGHRVFVVA